MKKSEMDLYKTRMEQAISSMNYDDQRIIEYARGFVNELQLFNLEDGERIDIEPMDVKTLHFFVFSIILDYTTKFRKL